MSTHPDIETSSQSILRRFESYGFWGGLGLGLLVGVLVSGPNLHDWTLGTSVLVTVLSTIGGGVIGFLAGPISAGSTARGPGHGGGGFDSTSGGDVGGGGGDGAGGGGGSE